MGKQLLVLGCSQTKRTTAGELPALDRYDGTHYRVVRKFLREHVWPADLSVAILSAEHGLFGGLKPIANYDLRMHPTRAQELAASCKSTLSNWSTTHDRIHFALGKDYLPAVNDWIASDLKGRSEIFEGEIGMKSHHIKNFLHTTKTHVRTKPNLVPGSGTVSYFLPDWDDLLDPDFDFDKDTFSNSARKNRDDKHCCVLMQPKKMCDGVLVSLAQHITSKGPLRRIKGTEEGSLAPKQLRSQFGLDTNQWLFGDCGAFSYVNEEYPAIQVEQAVALYELHGFDFGASVDHIPVTEVVRDNQKITLSDSDRQARVEVTKENAQRFIEVVQSRHLAFTPVGAIQALDPQGYVEMARYYCRIGYDHLAIGGLVPLQDAQVEQIVTAVMEEVNSMKRRPWVHLFGVFRPKLQAKFRELKVDSFDSATYFRKAWLRADQNYLSKNGEWYAALRVPMTSDGRTRKKLEANGANIAQLEIEEIQVLNLLTRFDRELASVDEVIEALLSYDEHLTRSSDSRSMRDKYRKTLNDRPWQSCDCPFCRAVGIHIVIFRGANRNKRRGAHNTLMLYGSLEESI